jgi:hypothetical protein
VLLRAHSLRENDNWQCVARIMVSATPPVDYVRPANCRQ